LLHDASESMMNDVNSPLKRMCPDYKAIEARVYAAVAVRFRLPPTLDPVVKQADQVAYFIERDQLMPPVASVVDTNAEFRPTMDYRAAVPADFWINPLAPREARELFLNACIREGLHVSRT
jgi:5'-deoxynucleotidase YfbR-like HD superfamily hydrolase